MALRRQRQLLIKDMSNIIKLFVKGKGLFRFTMTDLKNLGEENGIFIPESVSIMGRCMEETALDLEKNHGIITYAINNGTGSRIYVSQVNRN